MLFVQHVLLGRPDILRAMCEDASCTDEAQN